MIMPIGRAGVYVHVAVHVCALWVCVYLFSYIFARALEIVSAAVLTCDTCMHACACIFHVLFAGWQGGWVALGKKRPFSLLYPCARTGLPFLASSIFSIILNQSFPPPPPFVSLDLVGEAGR